MAKGNYIGVDGVARKVKKMYFGVDGVARKVKKAYIGVDGVARLIMSGSGLTSVIYDNNGKVKVYIGDSIDSVREVLSVSFSTSTGVQSTLIKDGYLFVGGAGKLYRISEDGTSEDLSPLTKLAKIPASYLCYYSMINVGGKIVALATNSYTSDNTSGMFVVYSNDNGNTWEYSQIVSGAIDKAQLVYVNGTYYALRLSNKNLYRSTNLVNWTACSVIDLNSNYTAFGFVVLNNRLAILSTMSGRTYSTYSGENPSGSPTFTTKCVMQTSYNYYNAVVANGRIFLPSTYSSVVYGTSVDGTFKEFNLTDADEVHHVNYKDGTYMIGTTAGVYSGPNLDAASLILDTKIPYAKRIVV